MDLIVKSALIAVILILIAAGAFILLQKSTQHQLTSNDAVSLVISDLQSKNPNATITLVSLSNSTIQKNSWNIVVSVVYNATRPCPTLLIEDFDYPATGLSPSTENIYTTKCELLNYASGAPSYVISSPELAIVNSYDSNYSIIKSFVNNYGYNNTNVYARFFQNLQSNYTHLGANYSNIWLVEYTSNMANHSAYVLMSQSGKVLGTYNASPSSRLQ